jgi:hypothetical protein
MSQIAGKREKIARIKGRDKSGGKFLWAYVRQNIRKERGDKNGGNYFEEEKRGENSWVAENRDGNYQKNGRTKCEKRLGK